MNDIETLILNLKKYLKDKPSSHWSFAITQYPVMSTFILDYEENNHRCKSFGYTLGSVLLFCMFITERGGLLPTYIHNCILLIALKNKNLKYNSYIKNYIKYYEAKKHAVLQTN
jgi:hypothetical protein